MLILGSLGQVEEGTVERVEVKVTEQERARLQRVEARPPLSEILNLHDFEVRHALNLPLVI
jgi:L-lactate dehydrogenase (cytochrome)